MALIALTTADKVEVVESIIQFPCIAGEAIVAGAPVRLDTTTGLVVNAIATSAGGARVLGIALKTVLAGLAVTVLRKGKMDGFNFSQAYDLAIHLSDTSGRLGDVAGSNAAVIGRIVPGHATTLGTAPDKLLFVDL